MEEPLKLKKLEVNQPHLVNLCQEEEEIKVDSEDKEDNKDQLKLMLIFKLPLFSSVDYHIIQQPNQLNNSLLQLVPFNLPELLLTDKHKSPEDSVMSNSMMFKLLKKHINK